MSGKIKQTFLIILSLVTVALSHQSLGQDINPNPLTAKAYLHPQKLPQGSNGELNILMNLASGHHAYSDQFKLVSGSPKGLQISKFQISPTVKFYDKFSDKEKEGIKSNATMTSVVGIPLDLKIGKYDGHLLLTYQACTKKYCLLPKEIEVPISFEVSSSSANFVKGSTGGSTTSAHQTKDFLTAKDKGVAYLILIVFFAGFLTSLTPCIFPMIPITLAILGTQSEGQSRKKGFLLSLAYVHGIALTYALLGLLAASTKSLFGSFLGNFWVAVGLAAIFLLLALSMFGLFEIKLPSFLANRLSSTKTKATYLGAFVSGLIAGVIASPCVGPVLISILAYVSQTQDLLLGFFTLFTFAMGFGVLFILLGTFSHLINRVPKAGPWMDRIKSVFGVTMLGLALFYIDPVVEDRVFHGLLGLTFIAFCSFFGAFGSFKEARSFVPYRFRHVHRGLMIFGLLAGIMFGLKAIEPNIFGKVQSENYSKLPWQDYSEQAILQAKNDGKAVVIDFWADWCVACKELEQFTFSKPEIQLLKGQFTWLKFDATKSTPLRTELEMKYGIQGLPHISFYDKNGKFHPEETLTGYESEKKFAARLKRILNK